MQFTEEQLHTIVYALETVQLAEERLAVQAVNKGDYVSGENLLARANVYENLIVEITGRKRDYH